MKHILQLIRTPNLLIILLTMILLRFVSSGIPGQDFFSFFILTTGTVLIAAAGNIVNDLMDLSVDLINKPDRVIVNRYISRKNALIVYFLLNSTAIVLALAFLDIVLTTVFVFSVILLFIYSYKLKKLPLAGNLVVAFLCALVVLEVLWFQYDYLIDYWLLHLYLYAAFAFYTTLAREIIKDIEDIKGDQKMDCHTLPVVAGVRTSKLFVFISFLSIACLLSVEIYLLYFLNSTMAIIYLFCLLVLPLIFICSVTSIAVDKSDYHRLSRYMKIYMLSGLMFLLFI
jgi:4-hydroxybenzoate polyprenyltransferase